MRKTKIEVREMIGSDVARLLKTIADQANNKGRTLKKIASWVGKNDGKIIGWNIKEEDGVKSYHLVLTGNGIRFSEGEYPSPDMIFLTDAETWFKVSTGEMTAKDGLSSGVLWIRGNFHEAFEFQKIMGTIMSKAAYDMR
jgi:putative sterol carrier protein